MNCPWRGLWNYPPHKTIDNCPRSGIIHTRNTYQGLTSGPDPADHFICAVRHTVSDIDAHRRSPDISFAEHERHSRIRLGRELASKRAIYLDTKYWILLRDADINDAIAGPTQLLRTLRKGIADGKIFCPISETVFVELFKQQSLQSRLKTATLIDELSLGVAIVGLQDRVFAEIEYLIRSSLDSPAPEPLEHLVWQKLSYVLGVPFFENALADPATDLAIQKAFFDHLSSTSLREMVHRIRDEHLRKRDQCDFVANMNSGITSHSDELRSFQQAYAAEARGIVNELGGIAFDVLKLVAMDHGITADELAAADRAAGENRWKNLLFFALEQNRARDVLRTLHVSASLYASLRWNKGRQFRANDLWDFSHASAALPYCDAFFTERSLHTMVTERHVALDKLYACHVTSNESDAISFLAGIADQSHRSG